MNCMQNFRHYCFKKTKNEVLKNLELVFAGVYLNYSDKPSKLKESISQRTKLRRKTSDDFPKKTKHYCL